MKKIIGLMIISLIVIGCQVQPKNSQALIKIKDKELPVEIAQTSLELYQGLSNIESLDYNQGMLFILPKTYVASFVMREMNFPLDFIWINNKRVIDLTKNAPVPTSTELTIYQPSQAVSHVLEVNAGWVEQNNIKIGDKVELFLD